MTQAIYPGPDDFSAAIAKPFEGAEFTAIAKALGVSWADAVGIDRDVHIYDISLPQQGLRFTFEDEGVLFDREYHDPGEGPFVLTKCTFWGHEKSVGMYRGGLWKGIDFNDSLEQVLEKVGPPSKINERDSIYFWQHPGFKVTMQWQGPNKIRVLTFWMTKG